MSLNGLLLSLLLPSPTCALSVMEGRVGTEVATGLLVRVLLGEGDLSNGREGRGEGREGERRREGRGGGERMREEKEDGGEERVREGKRKERRGEDEGRIEE